MIDIKVYDAVTDELVPVTQMWCDVVAKQLNLLALQRELVRKIYNLNISKEEDVVLIRKINKEIN